MKILTMCKGAALIAAVSVGLTACIVAPPRPAVIAAPQQINAPAGVVYVEPMYPAPAPGYVWMFNPVALTWGYFHRAYGWHR
jgi:hypothetical protein